MDFSSCLSVPSYVRFKLSQERNPNITQGTNLATSFNCSEAACVSSFSLLILFALSCFPTLKKKKKHTHVHRRRSRESVGHSRYQLSHETNMIFSRIADTLTSLSFSLNTHLPPPTHTQTHSPSNEAVTNTTYTTHGTLNYFPTQIRRLQWWRCFT